MEYAIGGLVGVIVGGALGFFFDRLRHGAAYKARDQILQEARNEASNIKRQGELEAKEQLLQRREELEKDLNKTRDELRDHERKLDSRESSLDDIHDDIRKKERMLETTQKRLADRTKVVETREQELDRLIRQEQEELHKISGLSKDDATRRLLDRLEQTLRSETGGLILKKEQELKSQSEQMAREIIGMAVQPLCVITYIRHDSIDRRHPQRRNEGADHRTRGQEHSPFEKETGVDVIVDDTPGVVVVSAFDTVRREVAKLSLQKLILDGRIHPTRIEEVVAETQKEMDAHIDRLGREAADEAGVVPPHEKLTYLMGRLNFRVSYSQNVLRHSIEVSHLTGMMAEQLGLDGKLGRRCGFFHDIGKAADHEMEGGHPAIGAELLKRYGEGVEVVHAAAGHHDDIRPEYIYTVLTAAADACSASRPGSRRETLEKYVRRLEELETLAGGFPGVEQVYAVQAGREVRVIVNPVAIDDREAARLARDVAQAIEETMTYPGEVKVVVMRETRSVGVAK